MIMTPTLAPVEPGIAARALELLLYATEHLDVERALVVESATYSLLQAGAEHQAGLMARPPPRATADEAEPVRISRDGDQLRLTLRRPHVRNAYNAAMREAL